MTSPAALDRLNRANREEATRILARCCGASRWVDTMLAHRPFADAAALRRAADAAFVRLGESDWLEAFSQHPKIGDAASLRAKFIANGQWSAEEQSGTTGAGEDVIAALAEGNAAYQERFGFIYIVCATGRSAAEMLADLRRRLNHTRAQELAIAAAEQRRITHLRLAKLE
jgi:2-oxo-4-hydroxy-4-carboxy-5-ureidoimidazoline decarboxylase